MEKWVLHVKHIPFCGIGVVLFECGSIFIIHFTPFNSFKRHLMIQYNRLHKILEILSLLVLFAFLIIFFIKWPDLPDKVPVHFDLQGEVNRWGNKMELPGVAVFLYLMLSICRFIPVRFWNAPCKITDQNRDFVYSTSFTLLQVIKLETMLFFAITSLLLLHEKISNGITIGFLLILGSTIAGFLLLIVMKGRSR